MSAFLAMDSLGGVEVLPYAFGSRSSPLFYEEVVSIKVLF